VLGQQDAPLELDRDRWRFADNTCSSVRRFEDRAPAEFSSQSRSRVADALNKALRWRGEPSWLAHADDVYVNRQGHQPASARYGSGIRPTP